MEANGVNYYKGVLLCSRPNQSPSIQKQKPFCARVTPYDSLGLVPTKKFDQHEVRKRTLPVLSNHKKWLKSFKEKVDNQKRQQELQKQKEIRRLEKIKEEGIKAREELKNSQTNTNAQLDNTNNTNNSKAVNQATRMKKGKKPIWAKTDEQVEDEQEKEVDELIDFFENAEVKDYLDDDEVKKMVEDLKVRIQAMKKQGNNQEGNWKKKQVHKYQEAKKINEDSQKQKNDDILSRISRQSGSQSIAGSKTSQRVQQLQEKKNKQKQWDKFTSNSEKKSNIDDQIAKNVADEVLRNYPALKHHSNQSIRKLLQKQAHEQIKI